MAAKRTTHYRTCNLCEAMCGVEVEIEGKEILSVRGDKADVFSRGHVCPKATALKDLYDDPDRLKQPVRRVGDRWTPISWDEAFTEVADRIHRIQNEHAATRSACTSETQTRTTSGRSCLDRRSCEPSARRIASLQPRAISCR